MILTLVAACTPHSDDPGDVLEGVGGGGTGTSGEAADSSSDDGSSSGRTGQGGSGTTSTPDVGEAGYCGDGFIDADEECDDGNLDDADGCAADCTAGGPPPKLEVYAGGAATCAVFEEDGDVKCWGRGAHGRLGYGMTDDIGDNEFPAAFGPVSVGGSVLHVAVGSQHACALLDDDSVTCWGHGGQGRLGLVSEQDVGDNELPAEMGSVDVGARAVQIAAGGGHTCALTDAGGVRCWGQGLDGRLGYGNVEDIGDNEPPSVAGDVPLGAAARQIALGLHHSCALLMGGRVRCWGRAAWGRLGQPDIGDVGDDEFPDEVPPLDLSGPAVGITAGNAHTCALLDGGDVQCWGRGDAGQLGYGNTESVGDNEAPADVGTVELGAPAVHVAAGGEHTCALLHDGGVRCWGRGDAGQLGSGDVESIGDNEVPSGDVELGAPALWISAAVDHTCATLKGGGVTCWGYGGDGRLGYGNTENIGDDDVPAMFGTVIIE